MQFAVFRKVLDKKDKKKRQRDEDGEEEEDVEMETEETEETEEEQRSKRCRSSQDPFSKVPDEEPTPSLSELRERSRLRREKTMAVTAKLSDERFVYSFMFEGTNFLFFRF